MKSQYVCELCGGVYDDYDECYACENSHVKTFTPDFEPELQTQLKFKSKQALPDECTLAVRQEHWDNEKQEYVNEFFFADYKLQRRWKKDEVADVLKKQAERLEEKRKANEKWWADWHRREEERKAKEEAKAAEEEGGAGA